MSESIFNENGVQVSGNKLSFPSGFFLTDTSVVNISDIEDIKVNWNNWLHLYLWRFIIGPLGMLSIIGIPQWYRVLIGYVQFQILVRKGRTSELRTFYLHHSNVKTLKYILKN